MKESRSATTTSRGRTEHTRTGTARSDEQNPDENNCITGNAPDCSRKQATGRGEGNRDNQMNQRQKRDANKSDAVLSCFYTNADQLPTKMTELKSRLETMQRRPDIIAITEVMPKNARHPYTPQEFQINGYTVHANNLQDRGNRGILIYISTCIDAATVEIQGEFKESLWLKLQPGQNKKDWLLLGCVYRSPQSTEENNNELNNMISNLTTNQPFKDVLILGDFNYRNIRWQNETSNEDKSQRFLKACQDCFLTQHVTEPTRKRHGQEASLLDLILTMDENCIQNLEY
jgi:hypothetical protein